MNVHVFVSTMNGEIDYSLYPEGDYSLTIINQGTPLESHNTKSENPPHTLSIYNVNEKGLSSSRNLGISLSKPGDIIVLTDNDVSLCSGFENEIKEMFLENSNADVITFQAENNVGKLFKADYLKNKFDHNFLSIMKVSSIEIAFKYSDKIPFFDINFGLGARVPIGEENIFLSDCLNNNCKVIYIPKVIVKHNDDIHSGKFFTLDLTQYRKLVFTRVYGFFLGRVIFHLFLFKNRKRLDGGFFKHLKNS